MNSQRCYRQLVCWCWLAGCLVWLPAPVSAEQPLAVAGDTALSAEDIEYFERKIRPLLSQHCYECHSADADTVHAGLLLDSAQAIAAGGDSGPLLTAGKPEQSLLIKTIRYDGDIQMPPQGAMAKHEIAELTNWVRRGAPFPPSSAPSPRGKDGIDFDAGRTFWSFQPVQQQPLPEVQHRDWPRTRTDTFVLAAMEQHGLSPSPAAARATLARRLYFDLTGLPPTPDQVQAFVNDERNDAYQRLVNQLLESPQYGEKWGRWWLDMARYTDRTASWLSKTGQAFRYRDWVVEAFNDDMPYDQFVHRQLATDLMPQTGPDDLPALGFISLSPTYWKEPKLPCEIIKTIVADEWEERVDAVSRTFLGLTVACARCHDHKFDPISSEDYYALAGVFASCRHEERPLIGEAAYQPVREAKAAVAKLEAAIAKAKKEKSQPKEKIAELQAEINEIKAATPLYDTPMVNALVEEATYVVRAGKTPQDGTKFEHRAQPRDLPAFIRGNPNRPGKIVPRRFLTVLSDDPVPFQNGSGRLELAESITTDAASLAARVIVNRVWLAHFDQGIVATPSNFGQQGERPTHPELLDDLAARFIAEGWSIKSLHREILLSATWQQSSADDPQRLAADPENRWLSRMNRRRLTFEEWRDAMLAASGTLNAQTGGASQALEAAGNHRRTLYATVHRRDMAATLMVHDFPDPTQHSPMRTTTITPLQGLYALNGPLLLQHAGALEQRLIHEVAGDDAQRIRRAYQLLFSRPPTERELQLGGAFVAPSQTRWQAYLHVLLAANEFAFVD
ncbi:PSD1 and planctomycete cytochrome C domain-containing protein [Roseimaritima ulvae]|uniref:Planctomycete cytochrome C n=1 Tax=Roseimaritima ulvae TaxID=980254 RepID=A0A5B9QXK3_9BACT|nr:PSD1 and planctomycete cytochrome C domain-containing protein [Roseimaritima ulvae]QEG42609.1 Planctomycete cytochrome C [Roseimaritima ulvae]